MFKAFEITAVVLFIMWVALTTHEFMGRETGAQVSILSQLFVNYGISYFILVLVILWFMKKTGLNRLPKILDNIDEYLQKVDRYPVSDNPIMKNDGTDA